MKSILATSLTNRLHTIFRKTHELSTLCEVETCVIYYGPDGELKTWPQDRQKVKDLAFRYQTATKRKKCFNLHEFMAKQKNEKQNNKKVKRDSSENVNGIKYPDWYPVFDHYSPTQLRQLILSLEQTLSELQEKLRFVQAQKQQMNTNMAHQTQPLRPAQFSYVDAEHQLTNYTGNHLMQNQLTNYNENDHLMQNQIYGFDHNITSTDIQHPFISNTQEDYSSALITVPDVLENQLMMQQELYGFDYNITSTNIQHPLISNTQEDYSSALTSVPDVLENQLMMQHELYGFDQNKCMMSDITKINVPEHTNCLSTTVPDQFFSDFQNYPYGDLGGCNNFLQDFPDVSSNYDESSMLQTSYYLPSIPDSYFLSDNPRFV